MLKFIVKSAMVILLVLGLSGVTNYAALAAATCTVNGQLVDCAELNEKIGGFLGWIVGALVIFLILAVVFWIMMIVHAANHDIENRGMWILLMVFTGLLGAVLYYFLVKRKFSKQISSPAPMKNQSNRV